MLRWIVVLISVLVLACVSLQPAAACEQSSSTDLSVSADGDDAKSSSGPEFGIDRPELFVCAHAALRLDETRCAMPSAAASRLAADPYLGALLRPPCA